MQYTCNPLGWMVASLLTFVFPYLSRLMASFRRVGLWPYVIKIQKEALVASEGFPDSPHVFVLGHPHSFR